LSDIAHDIGLHEEHPIERKVEYLLLFTGVSARAMFTELRDLVFEELIRTNIYREPYQSGIRKIVAAAARSRGEENPDLESLRDRFCQELSTQKPNGGFFFSYFGDPKQASYGGQEIIDLGIFPHSCTSYCILAQDLLADAGIHSELVSMLFNNTNGGHSVLRYQLEDSSWRRCDPKWQKRLDDDHERIFFRHNPELLKEFTEEKRPLLHGGHLKKDENGKVVYDPETNRPIQMEYEKQEVIRVR